MENINLIIAGTERDMTQGELAVTVQLFLPETLLLFVVFYTNIFMLAKKDRLRCGVVRSFRWCQVSEQALRFDLFCRGVDHIYLM